MTISQQLEDLRKRYRDEPHNREEILLEAKKLQARLPHECYDGDCSNRVDDEYTYCKPCKYKHYPIKELKKNPAYWQWRFRQLAKKGSKQQAGQLSLVDK